MGEQDNLQQLAVKPYTVLVTGSRGFIGSRLVSYFTEHGVKVRAMSRKKVPDTGDVRYVRADAFDVAELTRALSGARVAYYLLHSMEGSKGHWRDFADREKTQAQNFVRAAASAGVERVIYLGGLVNDSHRLSRHMSSRKRVGEILASGSVPVTELRASLIIGAGGGSYAMLRYLAERLPLMVCPKWVKSLAQPIAVDDVVSYLAKCATHPETSGRVLEIGGPDTMTYEELMRVYARYLNRGITIVRIPFLTTRLSSYWVDLITPVKASLARPLIDSLVHDTVVTDDRAARMIPIRLHSVAEAIDAATKETSEKNPVRKAKGERTGHSGNQRILMASLLALSAIGSSYYWLDGRPEAYQAGWLLASSAWFVAAASAIRFVRHKTRLGYLVAGVLSWAALGFWLSDGLHTVLQTPLVADGPGLAATARNLAGMTAAAVCIAASHNAFHKIRRYQSGGIPLP